jgi:hypothetical protein
MEEKTYRQGDVIIIPTKELKGEQLKHLTLAEGEVTGHSHQISDGVAALFKFDDEMYLKVTSERATLSHEEHGPIELLQGDYKVIIQREYSPDGWKYVAD